MFTGIVEERGIVLALEDHRLVVGCGTVTAGECGWHGGIASRKLGKGGKMEDV